MFELTVPVGVTAALTRLAVGLWDIAQSIQQPGYRAVASLMALTLQLLGQLARAFARPPCVNPACDTFRHRIRRTLLGLSEPYLDKALEFLHFRRRPQRQTEPRLAEYRDVRLDQGVRQPLFGGV